MKKRFGALSVLLLIGLLWGCDSFLPQVDPLVVILWVNGQQWTGGDKIEARPNYDRMAVMVTAQVAGGDPNSRYRIEYADGTTAREEWFDDAVTVELRVNQTFTIRDGRATPVSYRLVIINNVPVVLSPWLSDVQPEMGAHLRVDVAYHQWGTCPTIQEPYYTGVYDADEEFGDSLSYRLRITGPKKASWEDMIQYRLYDDLPGTNEYTILTDQWLPVETQTHFFVGYDGPAPGIGALSAKDGGCGVPAQITGCCPGPDDPITDDPWPSGTNLCVEVWVKDALGALSYGKFYWEIYIGGCPLEMRRSSQWLPLGR